MQTEVAMEMQELLWILNDKKGAITKRREKC